MSTNPLNQININSNLSGLNELNIYDENDDIDKDDDKDQGHIKGLSGKLEEIRNTKDNSKDLPENGNDNDIKSTGNTWLDGAKALISQIIGLIKGHAWFGALSLVDKAKTLTETAMTDEVVNKSPILKYEALDLDTKLAAARGELQDFIQYDIQVAQEEKKANKDTLRDALPG